MQLVRWLGSLPIGQGQPTSPVEADFVRKLTIAGLRGRRRLEAITRTACYVQAFIVLVYCLLGAD
jgi:hypothetical protein